ncbi:EAL domain-containing response regulator [Coleofasciculus sp. E2-BRE-01]|uniref:EAL domain-containing response regulator n=1 Tax=Coleofasciculus sp. E2-BRE-01 TaxID=3069524 RepID=UPI0032F8987A
MKKILVIEDEELVRENILELLDAEGLAGIGATNGYKGIDLAKVEKPDLIICDVMMPGLDGYSVLKALRQESNFATTPFIFLTAKAAKADFRQGMELGADDYLTKPFTRAELLGAIATRFKKQQQYRSELEQAQDQLDYLMHHDSLTNLPNQLSLREQFKQIKSTHSQQLMTIICVGLDRFNQINDDLGHSVGDRLLQAVAQRLVNGVTSEDYVARLGSGQFAIILPTTPHKKDAVLIAQTLLEQFSQTFAIDDQEIFITASIGMALYPRDGRDIEQLLNQANKAMFQAKQQGGNCHQFYSITLSKGTSDRVALKTNLRYALERDELQVYYQPQLDLETGKIIGAEALLRWEHPERGLVSPIKFIPLAEETGLILPIGEWVLKMACQQTRHWQKVAYPHLKIAVNLSGRQFQQLDLRHRLVKIFTETGLRPEYLELELTESMLVENTDVAIRRLQALKALGVEIAIDDFGTGYSSLSYLQQFPFDTLKIDRCFIRNIQDNPSQAAITQAIIEMANTLDLKLVAEGVETDAELSFVVQHHCHKMQGYLFSKPLPAKEFESLLFSGKYLAGVNLSSV